MSTALVGGASRGDPNRALITGSVMLAYNFSQRSGLPFSARDYLNRDHSAKRGTKLITSKRVSLSRTCEYKTTFTFKTRTAPSVRLQAKFGGNEVLTTASSKSRTARLG